jgi:hypothetical protein
LRHNLLIIILRTNELMINIYENWILKLYVCINYKLRLIMSLELLGFKEGQELEECLMLHTMN